MKFIEEDEKLVFFNKTMNELEKLADKLRKKRKSLLFNALKAEKGVKMIFGGHFRYLGGYQIQKNVYKF